MKETRKRCRVVMLPTDEKSYIHYCPFDSPASMYISNKPELSNPGDSAAVHLYITSDEEIKEGDYYIHMQNGDGLRARKCIGGNLPMDSKKIIATTNLKLTTNISRPLGVTRELPQPSQDFIKKYCKAGGIEYVDVEYISCFTGNHTLKDRKSNSTLEPKIDSNNTITIHSSKDSWNIKEMEDVHVAVMKQGCLYKSGDWSDEYERLARIEFDKWAEENL